jgi:pimeloyl-ACP methyl ester carboxylesterase
MSRRPLPITPDVLLVHGGFHPSNDAEGFWAEPGVIEGLTGNGFRALAPNRAAQPCSWRDEGDHLAAVIDEHGARTVVTVAGSNGCSAAVRTALDHPSLVRALVLCWPATAGDPTADALGRAALSELGWTQRHIDELLLGDTLRGVLDQELRGLAIPVVVIPSEPFNTMHQKHTVDRIIDLIPGATLGDPFPETPSALFAPRRAAFVAELTAVIRAL